MTITLEVSGLDGLDKRLKRRFDSGEAALQRVAEDFAAQGPGQIRRSMQGARFGKEYPVPGRGVTYRASLAGETPVIRTGNLANNLGFAADAPGAVVFAATGYAAFLEQGTAKMEARPFMEPWAVSVRTDFTQEARRELRRALNA